MELFGIDISFCTSSSIAILVIIVVALLYLNYRIPTMYHSLARLDGKTVIITGANTGIGKETALDIAKRGAKVILACRSVEKGKCAANYIRSSTGNNRVEFVKLDLASFQSIRNFAKEILASEPEIHILINNAGVMATPYLKTEDGNEMQFGVNHLGHFLLTLLLLERLTQSAPARIINLSSLAYMGGKIHFDDINMEKKYDTVKAYCQSKLANILFTRELAKLLKETGVTVYSVHPGAIRTELARYFDRSFNTAFHWLYDWFTYLFYKTAKQGAQTTIYCTVAEDLCNESGNYYSDCHKTKLTNYAMDDAVAKKLWEVSERMTKINVTDLKLQKKL